MKSDIIKLIVLMLLAGILGFLLIAAIVLFFKTGDTGFVLVALTFGIPFGAVVGKILFKYVLID